MRPRTVIVHETDAARALHRLAFALWRAAFYLQRGPSRNPHTTPNRQDRTMVCMDNLRHKLSFI